MLLYTEGSRSVRAAPLTHTPTLGIDTLKGAGTMPFSFCFRGRTHRGDDMVDYDENYLSSRLTEPELLVERQGSSGGFLKGVFSSAAIKCMSPLRRSAERLTAAPVRSVRQASQGLAEPPGRNVGW